MAGARPLRYLALAVGCGVLILVFVFVLFPYERIQGSLTGQLEAATGARVVVGELRGGLGLLGPGLSARQLRASWPDGTVFAIESGWVRPAWSFSWLRGRPAVHLDLRGLPGEVRGTLWPGAEVGFEGRVEALPLEALPLENLAGALPLTGLLSAALDLERGAAGLSGDVDFEARDGSVSMDELPFDLPYERLEGELVFDDPTRIEVRNLSLAGPMLTLEAEGSVGRSPQPAMASLDLQVDLQVVDPNLRPVVASQGLALDGEGRASLAVGGTVGRPRFD